MRRIIWSCWFQGQKAAPELVQKCLQSWKDQNPGWDFRCLDAESIARYIDLSAYVDLSRQRITAASLSDILRLLLLHEYGGVWVDATTFCNTPLDQWLGQAMHAGFFAFARPGEDRELATWFLAARPGNRLLSNWAARAIAYWQDRESSPDYFWVHHQFGELIAIDRDSFNDWQATPRISADGPHTALTAGLDADFDAVRDKIDWSAPMFKLTYRFDGNRQRPNSLLRRLLGLTGEAPSPTRPPAPTAPAPVMAQLRVATENLGDHIQIIAGQRLLVRAGLVPGQWVDRDDEIANPPAGTRSGKTGILLDGWFKTNPAQWPPHPAYLPVYLGFHIRLFQSPSLTGPEAIAHYRSHGPIGCRDPHTLALLRSLGVDAFLSHCLSLTLPRRLPEPETQTEVFVVSRDERLVDLLPNDLRPFTFISQYSGDHDFVANIVAAEELLETYRSRARLIITSLLHCALPAIAMGIPVVVIYPPNEEPARTSDRQRFSALSTMLRVFVPAEANLIDWRGDCLDVGDIKLRLVDHFFALAARWGQLSPPVIKGIAPSAKLPVPDGSGSYSYFADPERLERLVRARAPDRQKWGAASSYKPEWSLRSELAAGHIADGESVLEIGTGTGAFRALVAGRCHYTGADLQPVDPHTLTLNLESDPIPEGPWDAIVLLGVLEYIHNAGAALTNIFAATGKVVLSYCCPQARDVMPVRKARGWVNALSEEQLLTQAANSGFTFAKGDWLNSAEDFEQKIFVFLRNP